MAIPTAGQQQIKGKRANRLPIILTVAGLALFLTGMIYAIIQRSNVNRGIDEGGPGSGAGVQIDNIDVLSNAPEGGITGVSVPEGSANTNSTELNYQRMLEEERMKMRLQEFRDQQNRQKEQMEWRVNLVKEAIGGDINLDIGSGSSSGGMVGTALAGGSRPMPDKSELPGMTPDQPGSHDRFVSSARTKLPLSDYEIKTGTVIPGVMISAINSDLPGEIVAQVTTPVYDSRTGRHMLIPQGTKLFGRYDSRTKLGQTRLDIVWDRLIFPDNETLVLNGMRGMDGRGLAGAHDKVNTHFWETLMNAYLLSTIAAAMDRYDDDDPGRSLWSEIGIRTGDTMEDVISEYIEDRLKIKPTLEIRAGYRFNVMVNQDLIFEKPYEYGYTKRIVENETNG